jgi:hypothetical protein
MHSYRAVYTGRHNPVGAGIILFRNIKVNIAFLMRLMQIAHALYNTIDAVNAGIEVILDLIKITVVFLSDLRRQITFADPLHVLGCYVKGPGQGIQGVVKLFNYLAVLALVPGNINPDI